MNKCLLLIASLGLASGVSAQSAMDAFQVSQQDMKGTARFMSMAGAFGALGADLTVLSQNPGGIGVYRNSDIGFTLNLDCQKSTAKSMNISQSQDKTRFYLNNIGYVGTFKLPSKVMPNINFGFTFNKTASFNRQYRGGIPQLSTSLSNYIAGINNSEGITEGDLETIIDPEDPNYPYDPYNPMDGGYTAPWLSILGYDACLTSPVGDSDNPTWVGQFRNRTSGYGYFTTEETGSIDEYNISFGGNIANVVFWGMDFGIVDMNYTSRTLWGEELTDAYIPGRQNGSMMYGPASWSLYNYYNMKGTGFNYKLGVIVRPIQELRFGLAFHTPTWYTLDQTFYGDIEYAYDGSSIKPRPAQTNNGYDGYSSCSFRTPWKVIASVAGVIGHNFIISADYEWTGYKGMKFSDNSGYDYWDWSPTVQPDPYAYTNGDIKTYYKPMNTIRIGAEFRPVNALAVRAGYAHSTSPVTAEAKDGETTIYTSGTRPAYAFDNSTDYITCGLGFKKGGFYADAAYVWKHRTSEYHAFAQDPSSPIKSPSAKVTSVDNQIVLTMGFKF